VNIQEHSGNIQGTLNMQGTGREHSGAAAHPENNSKNNSENNSKNSSENSGAAHGLLRSPEV
jgi:hypothetical protein